jgi:hypothetical protein
MFSGIKFMCLDNSYHNFKAMKDPADIWVKLNQNMFIGHPTKNYREKKSFFLAKKPKF